MGYKFELMKQDQALDIAYSWHYEEEYSFYDMEADEEDLVEFLDPERRGNSTYIVNVYKKVGFKEVNKFNQYTNGSNFEFVQMIYMPGI